MTTEITELIDRKDTISFDIFDTLLFRNIAKPTDIFRIMENIIQKKYGIKGFAKKRIKAEADSRTFSKNGESNIEEIYSVLEKNYISNKEILSKIRKLELELELEFIVANPFMKEIFDYCKKKNKNIILISDMYLKSDFIKELLDKCGYCGKYKLYVSCENRANKCSGTLFELVHKLEKVEYNNWVHIGDNINSDFNIPKSLGITAYNYKNINTYENVKCDSIFESIILGIRNNYLYNGKNTEYWGNFGVKCLVPIYLGFTNWLYNLTYKCDNLFFLARDGYIIEKIYKMFPNNKATKYIYCSRNSLQIPVLYIESKDLMIENLINIYYKGIRLKKLFNICKLECKDEYKNILNLYGFNSFNDEINNKNRYLAIKCICAVIDDVKDKYEEEIQLAKEYLKQEGLLEFDTINIVDIGWSGSVQQALNILLDKRVRGYYFGTMNTGKKDYMYNSFGYMFDLDNDIYDKTKIFSQVMMYELAFSAPHGSTEKYIKKGNIIEPVLKKCDDYSNIVKKFQEESLKVIKEIMKYYKYYDNLNKYFCIQFYYEFLDSYRFEDLTKFEKINNDYIIGDDKKFPYVQRFSKDFLMNHFSELEKEAEKSLWKGAFLVEGCETEEEHNSFLDEVVMKNCQQVYPSKMRTAFRKYVPYNIRKALKKNT